ncbi:MAG TPA: sorbosone dehydrogenase family protein [Thermoanaerobaculia bacterium]|nr:sorbosone dehydrogenase family protein [Thermoanaerobaculia bacterium]
MTARRMLLIISFVSLACRAQTPPPVTNDPKPQHHLIRADQLPPPFETPSSGNPPAVVGRPANASLHLPPGFKATVWATDLEEPRTMTYAPNGDIFVVESGGGRIKAFRDANADGVPESSYLYATGLNQPYGIAFRGNQLYVGTEDAVVRFAYTAGAPARGEPQRVTPLPPGGHWTRGVAFNRDGSKMYVSIGSRSNVSVEDEMRAAIVEYNPDGSGRRIFASGLRNPVGLAWEPVTGALWTAVNERDGLGDDLPPDYITEVKAGAFYGWPYAYIGQHEEPRLKGQRPDLVKKAVVPSVLVDPHGAALGIAFYTGKMFPEPYRGGAFVALHGSWNRSKRSGYKVIHVPFRNGRPTGGYDDFLTGFAPDPNKKQVWGRPVGVMVLKDGSLLVSDDGGGVVWRVVYGK